MQERKKLRQLQLNEIIITTHMFSILLIVLVFTLDKQLFSEQNVHLYTARSIFLICLIFLVSIIWYNNEANKFQKGLATLIKILYTVFPLILAAAAIYWDTEKTNYVKGIFILPVLITASLFGKRYSYFMIAGSSFILVVLDWIQSTSPIAINNLQSNLILICIIFIVGWYVGSFSDLEKQFSHDLTIMVNTDVLTGLYNHRYFYEQLGKQLEECEANIQPLSLILLDVDFFKQYNDSFGHLAGDQVLQKVGEILSKLNVGCGFAARYGGDEFVIVIPDCPEDIAIQIAHKIRISFNAYSFIGDEHQSEEKITISCGVATYPNHARDVKNLIKCADEALYKAKCLKKDKVKLYFSVFDNLETSVDNQDFIPSTRILISIINAKDRYTYGHSERVLENARKIANKMGMAEEEIIYLNYASFLHDIGKIEIASSLLNKSEKLTSDEWNIFMQHSKWGSRIVQGIKQLETIAPIILHHHENYDGTGYPGRLVGEDIPLLSRIIRIADSYDAMVSSRPYKKQMSPLEAIQELEKHSGNIFDPGITKHFIAILKEELS